MCISEHVQYSVTSKDKTLSAVAEMSLSGHFDLSNASLAFMKKWFHHEYIPFK